MAKLSKVRYPLVSHFPGKKRWDDRISPLETKSSSHEGGIKENDVVCGKKANANPGNEKFRLLIQRNRQAYQSTSARDSKKKIIERIIEQVHECGGRFLKVEGDKVLMEELAYDSCYEKVSHALRSARAPVSNVIRSKEELNQGFGGLLKVQKKLFQQYLAAEGLGLFDDFPTSEKAAANHTIDLMDIGPDPFDGHNHSELDLDQETIGFLANLR